MCRKCRHLGTVTPEVTYIREPNEGNPYPIQEEEARAIWREALAALGRISDAIRLIRPRRALGEHILNRLLLSHIAYLPGQSSARLPSGSRAGVVCIPTSLVLSTGRVRRRIDGPTVYHLADYLAGWQRPWWRRALLPLRPGLRRAVAA